MDPDEQGLAALVANEANVEVPEPSTQQTQTPAPQVPEVEPTTPTVQEPETPTEPEVVATPEPSQIQTEPKPEIDWTKFMTKPETVVPPTPDENGNVDRDEWSAYLVAKAKEEAKAELRAEDAIRTSVNRGLDQAEQILPEMKTNPKIAALVRDSAYARLIDGQDPDFTEAAKTIKELMGGVRAEATNNANVSVQTQQVAAVENGSSTQPTGPDTGRDLADRINNNDQDAFVELIDEWQKQGVL